MPASQIKLDNLERQAQDDGMQTVSASTAAVPRRRFQVSKAPHARLAAEHMPIIREAILGAPLLTPEQETAFFVRIASALDAAWDAVCAALDDPTCRPAEDVDWDALRVGQSLARECRTPALVAAVERTEARLSGLVDRLVRHNLRLVQGVAAQLMRWRHGSMGLDDAVQEASIGLVKAIRRFDPAKSGRLSTFAVQWIRHHVGRAHADTATTIRTPVHVSETVSALIHAARKMGALDIHEAARDDLPRLAALAGRSPTTIENSLSSPRVISGDASASRYTSNGDENTRTILDMAADPAPAAVDTLADAEVRRHVQAAAAALPDRERLVLTRRFGLDGEDPETLVQVGDRLGVSRERARQIETLALRRARAAVPFLAVAVGL